MSWLGLDEAETLVSQRLGNTPRAAHSRFVGRLMAELAPLVRLDPEHCGVVGLVHDLDYFAVAGDWAQHGLLTANWLADRLPAEALAAIAAHDHRTGVTAGTPIADLLKLADAMAGLDERAGRQALLAACERGFDSIHGLTKDRPFLGTMIETLATRGGLTPTVLAKCLKTLPRQPKT